MLVTNGYAMCYLSCLIDQVVIAVSGDPVAIIIYHYYTVAYRCSISNNVNCQCCVHFVQFQKFHKEISIVTEGYCSIEMIGQKSYCH